MIDGVLYGALGFFLAGLLALLFAPLLWNRAARITTRKLEATLPMTIAEIRADKDQLRAEFAIELRRLEVGLEKAKTKAVRELVETSKGRVRIDQLEAEHTELQTKLQEAETVSQALGRTLKRRLPELESKIKASDAAITEIETANTELRHRLQSLTANLQSSRETLRRQRAEIDRLRQALQADRVPIKSLFGRAEPALAKENRKLAARLSLLEDELALARQQDTDDFLLREEMKRLSLQLLDAALPDAAPLPQLIVEQPPGHTESPAPVPASGPNAGQADGSLVSAEQSDGRAAGAPMGVMRSAEPGGQPSEAKAESAVRKLLRQRRQADGSVGADAASTDAGKDHRSGQSLVERLAARARRAAGDTSQAAPSAEDTAQPAPAASPPSETSLSLAHKHSA